MQAVMIHETGSPDVLHYEEADRPEPGDDQVLIRVHAASVNPTDWKARRGLSETGLPAVLGRDVRGAGGGGRGGAATRAGRRGPPPPPPPRRGGGCLFGRAGGGGSPLFSRSP